MRKKTSHNNFVIHFGDKTNSQEFERITVLKQVHGTQRHLVIPGDPCVERFKRTGDILLTNTPGRALGVVTADCLPIIFYDHAHHACAIAHAGWRGTVAHITRKTVDLMHTHFSTNPAHLEVFFGPSAGVCCYEVGPDFPNHIEKKYRQKIFFYKNQKLFFDNAKLNYLKLLDLGVQKDHIHLHPTCTICNNSYHSYRRDGKNYKLQLTTVKLTAVCF